MFKSLTKGISTPIAIIIIIVLAVVLVGGVLAYQYWWTPIKETKIPEVETPKDETVNWLIYNWGVLQFKYPQNWKVKKGYYRTPAQEAAGEPASVVGLSLFPEEWLTNQDSIGISGRQVNCSLFGDNPCFIFFTIPVYPISKNPEILKVFDTFIKTITYNNPDAAFQIIFPSSADQLEVNKKYLIQWRTSAKLQIQKVNLVAFDTSMNWQEGLILSADNISNTGEYEWVIPSTIKSNGPYLISISYCEPIIPPPPGTISSCKLHEGYSNPFYISTSNQ